jgi:hypothetical protein
MSNKHTPGPWSINERAQVVAADGGHIAYVECAPVIANARLVAAAPELLEALQLIAQTDPGALLSMRSIARAAIAKATA